jgi:hypothetical protein
MGSSDWGGYYRMSDEKKTQAAANDRRWDELKFIQETVYKVWSAYLIYFLWFHTAIYAVVSYSMGTGAKVPSRSQVWAAATICIISEGLSIAVTIALGKYSKNALRRVSTIVDEGNFHSGLDPRIFVACPGH